MSYGVDTYLLAFLESANGVQWLSDIAVITSAMLSRYRVAWSQTSLKLDIQWIEVPCRYVAATGQVCRPLLLRFGLHSIRHLELAYLYWSLCPLLRWRISRWEWRVQISALLQCCHCTSFNHLRTGYTSWAILGRALRTACLLHCPLFSCALDYHANMAGAPSLSPDSHKGMGSGAQ